MRPDLSGVQMRSRGGVKYEAAGVKRSVIGQRIARTRTPLATWADPRILLVTFRLEGAPRCGTVDAYVQRSWECRDWPGSGDAWGELCVR